MSRKVLPLFATLIIVIGIITGAADAQTRHKITLEASVPFEFVVGNRVFPAGTYVFEMATGLPKSFEESGVLVVRNHERKLYAAVATDVTTDDVARATPKVTFVRDGERVYLSKVWRQGNAAGLAVHTSTSATETQDWEESRTLTLDALAVNGGI
jgi:hypothetical protein